MGGRSARVKGATWERALAKMFQAIWPGARRGIGQTRNAGEVADVEGTSYWVEAKVGKLPNPRAALKQASEATDGRAVLVVIKDDRARPFVCMYLDDWFRLAADASAQMPMGETLYVDSEIVK